MAPNPLGDIRGMELTAIRPYKNNPRVKPKKAIEQTAKSIREFGWQQPIVVDGDMVIIVGHTRYEAAKLLGEPLVPVIVADDLTPEQVRAYRIMDNRARDYTTWDFPLLISELDGLDEDFADVLDLDDWKAIIDQYENAQNDDSDVSPDLDPDVSSSLTDGFKLSVVFDTQENADRAAPGILDMPGVVNVAYAHG